jgi:predicted dinucleotide-binding enzyme
MRDAVSGADAVVVLIPLPGIAKLPTDLLGGLAPEVPVIGTSNYYPVIRDPQISELDGGHPESVWGPEPLGHPVNKAFNNVLAHGLAELGQPEGTPGRLAITMAGEDTAQKRIVMDVANDVGVDPIDAGSLEQSWRQ